MTPEAILAAARARGWRIATAESCTGGMVAVALTDIAGSSDVFDRGFVTYSNEAKTELLGVDAALIHPPYSWDPDSNQLALEYS